MPFKVDLHIHTNKSDGAFSPLQIINKALKNELSVISITDHDTTAAIPEAIEYGEKIGIEVIPGIEISTSVESTEIHLLSYFFDYSNTELMEYLADFSEERLVRAKKIISLLQDMNVNITIDDVKETAGSSPITRPHIAQTIFRKNYTTSVMNAFYKYIGDNAPADVKKKFTEAGELIDMMHNAGGLVFIAHPSGINDEIIESLVKSGIDGIETTHPAIRPMRLKSLQKITAYHSLLESGGSDFHGGEKGDEHNLGKYYISQKKFTNIRNSL